MTEFEFDIEKITKAVKKHHVGKNKETKDLEDARIEFFCAATERLELQSKATRTIMIPVSANVCTNEEVETYVHRNYPEWRILKIEDDPFRVLVEEDPAWMKFTYVSKDRKTIFQRNVVQASPYLDDASLKEDDPDLWLRVTRSPEEELLELLVDEMDEDGDKHDGWIKASVHYFIKQHQDEFVRLLRPFEDLDEEDYAKLQEYILPGKLSYRLETPRKPKREELE